MYPLHFEFLVIVYLALLVMLAFVYQPWSLVLLPLAALNLALFMMPKDLRFAEATKVKRAALLYKTALVVNIPLFLLGAYLAWAVWFLGVAVWFFVGMNLAIANRVGRSLKKVERHPPSPLARGADENRALDAAAFWEKTTYFTDTALAVYIGGMLAATAAQISSQAVWVLWSKWIWLGFLVIFLVCAVRVKRSRALEKATVAAREFAGVGAKAWRPAGILDDTVMPALVARARSADKSSRQDGGGLRVEANERSVGLAHLGKNTEGWRIWLVLLVWLALCLYGDAMWRGWLGVVFVPSVLSYKIGAVIVALATTLCLWLAARRIGREPKKIAREMARRTYIDRVFTLFGLFVVPLLLLFFPLYAVAYMAHDLTDTKSFEMHPVERAGKSQPCVKLVTEELGFCLRKPGAYVAAQQEGSNLTFLISRSSFGTVVLDYMPRHGEGERGQ